MVNPNQFYSIVRRPVVTEKTSKLQFLHEGSPKYTFEVAVGANKSEVRKAVETLFGVKVQKVNIVTQPSKMRRTMGRPGRTPEWKKAVVTLRKGDSIEIA